MRKDYKNLMAYIVAYRKFQEDKLGTEVRELEPELKLRIEETIAACDEEILELKAKIKKQNQE